MCRTENLAAAWLLSISQVAAEAANGSTAISANVFMVGDKCACCAMETMFETAHHWCEIATMDLNLLSTFAAVHTAGSFSSAAEKLKVPRSTVSRAIAALENELD